MAMTKQDVGAVVNHKITEISSELSILNGTVDTHDNCCT